MQETSQLDELLQRFPQLAGKRLDVHLLPGGITNLNYKINVENDTYVLRVAGENSELLGIDRSCEVACAQAAARAGIGAEIVAVDIASKAMLTRFVAGTTITAADSRQPAVMPRIVKAVKQYHDSAPGKGLFSAFATVRNYHCVALQHGVQLPAVTKKALELFDRIEAEVGSNESPCPCHNDLLPANFIDDGTNIFIIDWEYAGMGDRFFDLGNLAVNHEYEDEQERMLLSLYFGEVDPISLRRLKLMRLVSDMRESMWGFLQAGVSTLDFDYMDYGQKHLQRFLANSEGLLTDGISSRN